MSAEQEMGAELLHFEKAASNLKIKAAVGANVQRAATLSGGTQNLAETRQKQKKHLVETK